MLRLTELLERLRPAGTPGAPTEGEQQHRHEQQAREVAAVRDMLREYEAAAQEIVAAGSAEADRLRHDGERRAHLIRAQLPDRIAIARAEAARPHDDDGETEVDHARHDAEHEIAQLDADALTRIPELTDAVVATVWSTLAPAPGGRP